MKLDEDAIAHVMEYAGISYRDAKIVVREGINSLAKAMDNRETVMIHGLGKFFFKERKHQEDLILLNAVNKMYAYFKTLNKEELNEIKLNGFKSEDLDLLILEMEEQGITGLNYTVIKKAIRRETCHLPKQ